MKKFNATFKEAPGIPGGAVYLFAKNILEATNLFVAYLGEAHILTEISEDLEYNDDIIGAPSDAEVMQGIYKQETSPLIPRPAIKRLFVFEGPDAWHLNKLNEVIDNVNKLINQNKK